MCNKIINCGIWLFGIDTHRMLLDLARYTNVSLGHSSHNDSIEKKTCSSVAQTHRLKVQSYLEKQFLLNFRDVCMSATFSY